MTTQDLSRRSSLCLLLSSPAWASLEEPSACCDLLARCAAQYQSETELNCQISVTITDSAGSGEKTQYVVTLKAIRNVSYYARKRVTRPLRSDIAIFRHDSTLTALDMVERKYLRFPYDPAGAEAREMKELHFRHYGRFALLDRLDVALSKLRGDRNRCGIELVSSKEDWTEQIWVDSGNLHVVRSVLQNHEFRGEYGRVRVKSVMDCRIGGPPMESDFVAVIPKGFRRTNSLSTP